MAHPHGDGHYHHHHERPRAGEQRRLVLTLAITVVGMVVEAVGGWVTNSLSLLSDAAHMLADVGAIALSLFALGIAVRPADARRTYGYYRLEILAALANGAVLIAMAIGIAIEAWQRLKHPEPIHLRTMAAVALFGLLINGLGLWLTHGGKHGSMNLRSTYLHIAGDFVNSVGVLVSAALIAWTGKPQIDAVVGFLIAGTIVWGAFRLCREAVDVLLEGVPPHLDFSEVFDCLGRLPGVEAVHDLHVWTITSGMVALSCHIVVTCEGPGCRSHDEILQDAREILKDRFRIEHTTIQFESDQYRHEEMVH